MSGASEPSRTIVVTGAASGIGAACVARLRADGDRTIGVDLQDTEIVADLATQDGRRRAVDKVAAAAPDGIDGLVTCAGRAGLPSRPGSVLVSTNYFGTVVLIDALRPLLARRAPGAAAVAISSNSTTVQPGISAELVQALLDGDEPGARARADEIGSLQAYPATKLAIARWVRHQAVGPSWAGAGICLNAVAPGMIDTPLVAEGRADPEVAPLLDMLPIPVGAPGRPEQVAGLVAFLLSDDARYCCGSVLFMDGGSDALLRPDDQPSPWQIELSQASDAFGGSQPDA